MPDKPVEGAAEALVVAALLAQGRVLHGVALVGALGAVVVLATLAAGPLPAVLCALALVLALAETYYALRVGFDARLLRAVGEGQLDWDALDGALVGQGLMPAAKAGRPSAPRLAGAKRLLRVQASLLGLEILCLGMALLLITLRARGLL